MAQKENIMNTAQFFNRLTTYVVNIVMHFHNNKQSQMSDRISRGHARIINSVRRHQWSRSLRCGSAAASLLGLRVQIPPRELMPPL
jgi:hypothetical protein